MDAGKSCKQQVCLSPLSRETLDLQASQVKPLQLVGAILLGGCACMMLTLFLLNVFQSTLGYTLFYILGVSYGHVSL